jgi:uncharacterized protein involved in outer membrane biogenesis
MKPREVSVMKKQILIAVLAVLLLVALILYQLFANLDGIVANVIEDVGSDVLKTDVKVSNVSIDLRNGKAEIASLTIANPQGYSSEKLFELKNVAVDIDLSSLGEDVLVIESVSIQNPRINFEGDADGGSNMQTLLDNINSKSSGSSASADSGAKSEAEETRMIISSFEMTGAQVKAMTEMKSGEAMEIELPKIKMSGIGKAQGGVTADVVAEEITTEMINATLKAAAKAGIKKTIEKKTKGFLDKFKGED